VETQLDMFTQAHRDHDPVTSVMAAASVQTRAGSQKSLLLVHYAKAGDRGLTDEEAGIESGLHKKGANYWRRCSDLRALGLIQPTGGYRLSRFHERRMVCVITAEGLRLAEGVQDGQSNG
jgi:hypothetical protein